MASGVFVSYRKSDELGSAGRVRDALAHHFGQDRVFFDLDDIRGGQRWEDALDQALGASGAVVLVIGPRWLEILRERQGLPETDYHLREITTALDLDIPIYPLRVRGAPMPAPDDLPDALRTHLSAIQWTEVYDSLFGPSMERVITSLEEAVGPGTGRATSGSVDEEVAKADLTVGPRGSDADHHEIADALAVARPDARILVRPGRYLKPLAIDRAVSIVADGRGEVLLDCDASPGVRSSGLGVVLQGLRVSSSAREAVGIEVTAGDCLLDGVSVSAQWPEGSTGLVVSGANTRAVVSSLRVSSVDVGIRFSDRASGRVERSVVERSGRHGLVVEAGADPKVAGCSLAGAGAATVRFQEGALGTIDDCAIGRAGGPTIEIETGAAPTIRGSRGPRGGSISAMVDRVAKARGSGRPTLDDRDRQGWTVRSADGGAGTILEADLDELRLDAGAATRVVDSTVRLVSGDGEGGGHIERCEVGRVLLSGGADPAFTDGCTIEPERGVKITVEVRDGAKGTFDGCEIIGRNVRDGSPDPAVLSDAGAPILRNCTVKNPGEGALWVRNAGTATIVGGEIRSSMSGPALVVERGRAMFGSGAVIGDGLRVESGGSVELDRAQVEADPVTGVLLVLARGASLRASRSQLRGPGLAAARKVGRWIESKSDKARGKVAGALGASPPVRIAAGASAEFVECALSGIGADGMVLPAEGVTFRDTTVDGTPRG